MPTFFFDQYHMMNNFVWGKQWTEDEETTLTNNKKIPLTANKLPTLINYLLGEQQQNTPQLQHYNINSLTLKCAAKLTGRVYGPMLLTWHMTNQLLKSSS